MTQKYNHVAASPIIKKKKKVVKATPASLFDDLPENMKAHCEKFEHTPTTDPLAVPVSKMFFRPGGVSLMLCKSCTAFGRTLEPKKLSGQRHGIVVPVCADCSRANHRISQIQYFSGVIKSIVDDAQEKGAGHEPHENDDDSGIED